MQERHAALCWENILPHAHTQALWWCEIALALCFRRILQLNRNAAWRPALKWSKDGTQWPNRFISEKRLPFFTLVSFTYKKVLARISTHWKFQKLLKDTAFFLLGTFKFLTVKYFLKKACRNISINNLKSTQASIYDKQLLAAGTLHRGRNKQSKIFFSIVGYMLRKK